MATPYTTKRDDDDSPSLDLAVAAVLWIGAVCLVVAVTYCAEQGVAEHMKPVIVAMHQYYGKWIVAGVAAMVAFVWLLFLPPRSFTRRLAEGRVPFAARIRTLIEALGLFHGRKDTLAGDR